MLKRACVEPRYTQVKIVKENVGMIIELQGERTFDIPSLSGVTSAVHYGISGLLGSRAHDVISIAGLWAIVRALHELKRPSKLSRNTIGPYETAWSRYAEISVRRYSKADQV